MSEQMSFLDKILSLFTRNDPEADKKRMLKNIAKQLNHSKFKFYKHGTDSAFPEMAKLFFAIYKTIGPAQAMFQNASNPNAYKNMIIDSMMSDAQRKNAEFLEEEKIFELSRKMPLDTLKQTVDTSLGQYMADFDSEKINQIDFMYNKLSAFIDFCNFDYYFLLKKYDPNIQERNFNYVPKFETIRGEYIVEDLQNFTAIAWGMPLETDWTDIFKMLKEYRHIEPVALNQWNKIVRRLIAIRDQGVFEMMIQLIKKDPAYQTKIIKANHHIIEAQLEKIKKGARSTLLKLETKQRNARTEDLVNQIFGTNVVLRLKNYSDTSNANFEKHSLQVFKHQKALNYMKAFLIDYCKKDMREFSDLILVRGKWASASLATPMSEAYHLLLNISDKITQFDQSLSEEEELGTKLKGYVVRVDRDREAKKIANNLIGDANDKAKEFLTEGINALVIYAKTVKSLLEDYGKKNHELLINWKELERFADTPIQETGVEIYKKLYLFVSLMKLYK